MPKPPGPILVPLRGVPEVRKMPATPKDELGGGIRVTEQTITGIGLYPLHCKRCGYDWFPRTTIEPKHCPKCNSAYWNLMRRSEVKAMLAAPLPSELKERKGRSHKA